MDSEFLNDKLGIKKLLFTKAIPNYVSPATEGHKVNSCTDCGDRYIIESSYDYHINRKSVKITYKCRHCGEDKIFYNRCNFLSHIRSHAFKTATINVTDLKVEPMPLDFFSNIIPTSISTEVPTKIKNKSTKGDVNNKTICYECKKDNTSTGIAYKDRAKHYMQYTKVLHPCPVCMFTLFTVCALKAHLRIHLNTPPFYCPECGVALTTKSTQYPYSHDCEGFKMMRATARVKCPLEECHMLHPNKYIGHIKTLHLKKIYKCPNCVEAFFDEDNMQSHLNKSHYQSGNSVRPTVLYQCELCSGKLVLQSRLMNHIKIHFNNYVYPCWVCGTIFMEVTKLISHNMCKHSQEINISNQLYSSVLNEKKNIYNGKSKHDYSETKLSNSNPNKNIVNCYTGPKSKKSQSTKPYIICHLCKSKISQKWRVIKEHYSKYHKSHKCVDIEIKLKKLSTPNYNLRNQEDLKSQNLLTNKINHKGTNNMSGNNSGGNINGNTQPSFENNDFVCIKCDQRESNKELLELHITSHRDPYMAYQCLECGESFAVKPSFSTHLLLEHGISDAMDYIHKKNCFNEQALAKNVPRTNNEEPLKENQCQICRYQFDDLTSLEKHFRIHGMAFLLKNTNKNAVQG